MSLLLMALGCGSDDRGGGGTGSTKGSAVDAGAMSGAGTRGNGKTPAGQDGANGGAGGAQGGTGAASSAANTCDSADAGGGKPRLLCGELVGTCGGCIRDKCCDLAELCTVSADCACMAMCIGSESLSGTQGCLDRCGLEGSPPGFAELATCAATTCPDASDECDAPASYEPPPDLAPADPSVRAGIGSGALADCSFGASDATGSILQLQSRDGTVCVRIERRNDGPGSLANTSWTLVSMRVGPLGDVVLIDDPADLCWYSSHHNFNDWAHAWSGSRHHDVKVVLGGHGATPTYTLHVFEQGPLASGSCEPTAEGTCPIATMDLFPAP